MYCDFYSLVDRENSIPRFIKAIAKEIKRCSVDVSQWIFETIFIGGGTPSILDAKHIETILSSLSNKYDLSAIKEFTIEANPGEAPLERLNDIYSLGINRISIGVQTLEPKLLSFLTRIHTVNQVFKTFDNARTAGFNNINCDLIYSIPGQSWKIWERDLNQIIELQPNHISAYTLTLEKGTDLYQSVKKGLIRMPDDNQTGDWFLNTHDILDSNKYKAYEISNFSKPGMECRHNLNYWRILPYLAFGPSAHGFDGSNRWNNIRSLGKYLSQIESNKPPISKNETLSNIDRINEIIGFGLRMREGFDLMNIPKQKKYHFKKNYNFVKSKYPDCFATKDSIVALTKKGMLYSDKIIPELLLN